jgi:hypothetical protein
MDQSVHWLAYGREYDGTLCADPRLRECVQDLERASPHVRRAVMDIAYALMAQEEADMKLMSAGVKG